jgi:hypothetical protein
VKLRHSSNGRFQLILLYSKHHTVHGTPASPMSTRDEDLILKSAATRSGGPWSDDDYDVLHEGRAIGRILAMDVPGGRAWMWSIFAEARKPGAQYIGHEPTRTAAMTAFATSWRC